MTNAKLISKCVCVRVDIQGINLEPAVIDAIISLVRLGRSVTAVWDNNHFQTMVDTIGIHLHSRDPTLDLSAIVNLTTGPIPVMASTFPDLLEIISVQTTQVRRLIGLSLPNYQYMRNIIGALDAFWIAVPNFGTSAFGDEARDRILNSSSRTESEEDPNN